MPDGVDIGANIREAGNMSLKDFYDAVKSHGKWDYKRQSPSYEEFGNFHYGVVGRAAGYPRELLLRAAGLVQEIISGTSRVEWGNFWDEYLNDTHDSSYGDDPRDQYWIRKGIEFHDTNPRKRRK